MKNKKCKVSVTLVLMLLFISGVLTSCDNDSKLNLDTNDTNITLKSIIEEKNKYETAVLVTGNKGTDITDQVITLKHGSFPNNEIKVSIDKVGTENSNSNFINLEQGKIKIINNTSEKSVSANSDVIKLKFEAGNQISYLEVLVILNNNQIKNQVAYNYVDEENFETLKSSSFTRNQTFLGIGYDIINSKYINRNDAKLTRPILDINKLNLAGAIQQAPSTSSSWDSYSGESVYTFYTSYNASLNVGYKAAIFSGGVKSEFKTTKEGSKTNRYAKGIGKHYVKEEYLTNTSTSTLRQYLSDDFLSAIQTATPAYIIDNFGSHIIARCYHGGVAEFNYSYTGSTLNSDVELTATINASFKLFSGNSDYGYKEKITDLHNNSYFSSYTRGGNNTNFINQETFNAGYNNWVLSIKTNPDIAGIGNFNQSFIPIWSLVALINSTKANAIQTEFNNRVNSQNKKLINYTTLITGLNVWNMKATNTPSGYTALVKEDMYYNIGGVLDANRKAKGDYIRIGYISQEKESNHDAIAEIVVLRGKNASPPTGWNKISLDLNSGAKGEYLYLAYRKVNQNDTKAIDFIGASNTGKPISNMLINSSWSWVNFYNTAEWADINKGCKNSNYIYLTVHKTDFKW